MKIWAILVSVVLGAVFGSFAACQVWRMRYKQEGKKKLGKWSVCLACGHRLTLRENIPVFSWVFLRGKCKKCKAKIGVMEILAEVGLALIFGLITWRSLDGVMSGNIFEIMKFGLMLILMLPMWILLLYDAKWGEMPVSILRLAVVIAAAYAAILGVETGFSIDYLLGLILALLILPGLYLALYKLSRETLVGSGDWVLCLSIALVLSNWWLALLELCAANILAAGWGMPALLRKKEHRLHFAPFLILAFIAVWLLKDILLQLVSF